MNFKTMKSTLLESRLAVGLTALAMLLAAAALGTLAAVVIGIMTGAALAWDDHRKGTKR